MPANFDLYPEPVPPDRDAPVTAVFRFRPGEPEGSRYELLPHVRVLSVTATAGSEPWTARFRYAFDDEILQEMFPGSPRRVEDVFGLDRGGPWVVRSGDRLAVRAWNPEAGADPGVWVFEGYAEHPQADLSGEVETVTFEARFGPVVLWDAPIESGLFRDVLRFDVPGESVEVHGSESCRFNPEGRGNCTLPLTDENIDEDDAHPAFLDHRAPAAARRKWRLEGAVRYLIYRGNPGGEAAANPAASLLRTELRARIPKGDGDGDYDPDDPDTYDEETIEIGDFDATGMLMPEALDRLLEQYGFGYCFRLYDDEATGDPAWRLEFYRADSQVPRKFVYLRPAGEPLDPSRTNLGAMSVQRDGDVANEWTGLTERIRYEADFLLAPKEVIDPADLEIEDAKGLAKFAEGSPDYTPKYREFVFDEDGRGHAELDGSGSWTVEGAEAGDLSPLLDRGDGSFEGVYSLRPRPGAARLSRRDADGEFIKARLFIAKAADFSGAPGLWNGDRPEALQEVTGGGWELLDDRLGVRLTCDDPESWNIGEPPADMEDPPFPSGVVRVIASTLADGEDAANPPFVLMLQTEIEGDATLCSSGGVDARRRAASPAARTVRRADDLRDRFRAVAKWDPEAEEVRFEDVEEQAARLRAHLAARRSRHELPTHAGSLEIPRITHGYRVGDRIAGVAGRGIWLGQNTPTDPDAPAVFPAVAAITWSFDGRIGTSIQVGDRWADARPVARRYRNAGV